MSGTIFRLSNGVGSPLIKETNCWMLAVNDLAHQIVTKKKMQFQSSRFEQRDFIPISDICNAIRFEYTRKTNSNFSLFNLVSSRTLTLGKLAQIISGITEDVLGYKPEIGFPEIVNEKIQEELLFSNKKILKAGFTISGNIKKEIATLLLNSMKWFGHVQS